MASSSLNDSDLGQRLLTLVILWFAGLYLRLPVLVAPPLAPLIDLEMSLNQTQLGALTTVPVLMLSLGALPGAIIIARFGPQLALVGALVIVVLASMARGMAPPLWLLFLQTSILGFAIAVMQPALPALVLRWCPGFVALGSATYMNGMLMGEFIGGGLSIPLLARLDDSWRQVLVFWSLPGLLAAMLVLFSRFLGVPQARDDSNAPRLWVPPLHEARVWRLGIILGAASASFFGTNAYLPTLLALHGEPDRLPGYLMLFNGTQVIGSLAMLVLAPRLVGKPYPIIAMAWGVLAGLAGILAGGGWVGIAAVILLGLTTCVQLILVVALVPQIAGERDAPPLAAGIFMVGYLLGFVVPLIGGVAADLLGAPIYTFVPLLALAVIAIGLSHLRWD